MAALLHKSPSILEGNIQPLEVLSGLGKIREDIKTEGKDPVFKEEETALFTRFSVQHKGVDCGNM